VRVFPISTEMQLRYTDFVEGNRKKVTELSGGRIGYMHISDTATQGRSTLCGASTPRSTGRDDR